MSSPESFSLTGSYSILLGTSFLYLVILGVLLVVRDIVLLSFASDLLTS